MSKSSAARVLVLLPLALSGLVACAGAPSPQTIPPPAEALPDFSLSVAPDAVFEFDPRIELLAGIQSRTGWTAKGAPGAPNRSPLPAYFEELSSFFAPFTSSGAMAASQSLLKNRNFAYDAPVSFALSLDGGSAFSLSADARSAYLVGRAGGIAALEGFAREMGRLYAASNFKDFLASHEEWYRGQLALTAEGFDASAVGAWLEDFYRPAEKPFYHYVFTAAMFPFGGGYGSRRTIETGAGSRFHVYQVIRGGGSGAEDRLFPSPASLTHLALHEFGHSFVNPAVDKAWDQRLETLFRPAEAKMEALAYGNAATFMKELVLRATVILGKWDLGLIGPAGFEAAVKREIEQGFYPIRRVLEILGEYRADRTSFPDFPSFTPRLLGTLAGEAAALAAAASFAPGPAPVESFAPDFSAETKGPGLPGGLSPSQGSTIKGGSGAETIVEQLTIDGIPRLKLSADAGTSSFIMLSRPITPKRGTLRLNFASQGIDIRKEPGQWGGSYVGFILTDPAGKRSFKVVGQAGSFPRGYRELATVVDPATVSSIVFAVFLNESGSLLLDSVRVGYDP